MQIETIKQPVRGCGLRKPGGTYLRTKGGSVGGELPPVVLIQPPVPTNRKAHRGAVVVNGEALLARFPEDEWLTGASATRAAKARGDAWAKEVFGMTLTMRLSLGECKDAGSAEEALAILQGRVCWGNQLLTYVKQLTSNGVATLPNAAAPFAKIIAAMQAFAITEDANKLLDIVAAIWWLADSLQPRHKGAVIRPLAGMLTVMGLSKDAVALLARYR